LDELRLHPANSQMTTYAHEPLIGVTHTCDANNKIMSYEYDAMGRLTTVKDHKGNILKQTIYNTQNPTQP
jgi:YD repeat-containing protein